jgi:hypothetical protein
MVPDGAIGVSSDSHFRYLSGHLVAIGLGSGSTVSRGEELLSWRLALLPVLPPSPYNRRSG